MMFSSAASLLNLLPKTRVYQITRDSTEEQNTANPYQLHLYCPHATENSVNASFDLDSLICYVRNLMRLIRQNFHQAFMKINALPFSVVATNEPNHSPLNHLPFLIHSKHRTIPTSDCIVSVPTYSFQLLDSPFKIKSPSNSGSIRIYTGLDEIMSSFKPTGESAGDDIAYCALFNHWVRPAFVRDPLFHLTYCLLASDSPSSSNEARLWMLALSLVHPRSSNAFVSEHFAYSPRRCAILRCS